MDCSGNEVYSGVSYGLACVSGLPCECEKVSRDFIN
jgi:hypothetical protein